MKNNKKLISILLVVVMAFFSCMLASCGEDEDTPDPVNPPAPPTQKGLSLSYSTSKISSGSDITVTVYYNPTDNVDICGFQLNILSGNNYFTFKKCEPSEAVKDNLIVEGDVNSSNKNEVRVVAYPSKGNGKETISDNVPTELAKITYTATSRSNADFSLNKKNSDFKNMICKYENKEGDNKATEVEGLVIN